MHNLHNRCRSCRPPGDNTVELLKSLGADVVVTPAVLGVSDDYAKAVAGLPPPRLGLNCVGGSIATSVSRSSTEARVVYLALTLCWTPLCSLARFRVWKISVTFV